MRAVLDTNVLVSAFATDGVCARLLLRANKREFELWTSPAIVAEFKSALVAKVGLSTGEVQEALDLLEEATKRIDPSKKPIRLERICRDVADDHILETALAAGAEYLVTGDRDLLSLGEFRKIRILSPREFELLFE